ncbi:MAG: ribonuclease HI [Actinomycetota bacterium]
MSDNYAIFELDDGQDSPAGADPALEENGSYRHKDGEHALQFPVPAPPARPFVCAADQVSSRSGISVRVAYRRGHHVWAAIRSKGMDVMGVRSGSIGAHVPGENYVFLFRELLAGVLQLRASDTVDIFCENDEVAERLRTLGLEVTPFFPPPQAVSALDEAIARRVESLFSVVNIATDASRGRQSRWVGHGWVLCFEGGATPVLGHKAIERGNVLEGELRAIRLGLAAARHTYSGTLDGRSAVVVSSDSQAALRMVTDPHFKPASANGHCTDEVQRILELTRHADVDFRWVKGHAGDPLNTIADRMAVLSRRAHEAGLSFDQIARLAQSVREDAMTVLQTSHLALAA